MKKFAIIIATMLLTVSAQAQLKIKTNSEFDETVIVNCVATKIVLHEGVYVLKSITSIDLGIDKEEKISRGIELGKTQEEALASLNQLQELCTSMANEETFEMDEFYTGENAVIEKGTLLKVPYLAFIWNGYNKAQLKNNCVDITTFKLLIKNFTKKTNQ